MVLALHVLIAITSLVYTTYLFVVPSSHKLKISYSLIALTVLSGVVLVWQQPVHALQACTTGLIYLAVMSFGVVAARKKLITAQN